jgi:hypothetical protein
MPGVVRRPTTARLASVQWAAKNVIQTEAALAILDDLTGTLGQTGTLRGCQQRDDGAHAMALPTMLINNRELERPIGSVGEQVLSDQKISLHCSKFL